MADTNDISTGSNIPVTLQGYQTNQLPRVVLGTDSYKPDASKLPSNNFWFLVVDLSSLKVVVNELSDSNELVPTKVQEYANKPNFLLIFTFVNVNTAHMPQGELNVFLRKTGSGKLLSSVEQISEQTGSSIIAFPSYGLVATLDQGDLPGFEVLNFYHPIVLPFKLMPIKVNDKTIYIAAEMSA